MIGRGNGVDLVLECTGVFKTPAKVQPYFDAGVAKVVVSASVKEAAALNIVYGVNHHDYRRIGRDEVRTLNDLKRSRSEFIHDSMRYRIP